MNLGTRIAIIGNAGGGKSTLARALGGALDLPVVHVDSIQYRPHWRRTPVEECDRLLDAAAAGERWIIDGFGSDNAIARRIRAADTVVLVDFALWRHYWWAAKRQWRARTEPRAELPEHCPEWSLAHTALLASMMWRVHRDYRPWLRTLVEEKKGHGNVVHIRSPADWIGLVDASVRTNGEQR